MQQIFSTWSRLISKRTLPLRLLRSIFSSPTPRSFHSLPSKRYNLARLVNTASSSSSPLFTSYVSGRVATGLKWISASSSGFTSPPSSSSPFSSLPKICPPDLNPPLSCLAIQLKVLDMPLVKSVNDMPTNLPKGSGGGEFSSRSDASGAVLCLGLMVKSVLGSAALKLSVQPRQPGQSWRVK